MSCLLYRYLYLGSRFSHAWLARSSICHASFTLNAPFCVRRKLVTYAHEPTFCPCTQLPIVDSFVQFVWLFCWNSPR